MQDRAALDRLYNNRAAVPTHQQDLDRWAALSARARAALACRVDLAYGTHPRERLDFFPAGAPGRPLLVFIHGGYWQALSKTELAFVAAAFAGDSTANVALLNYPLGPEADMDRIVAAVRRGILWLWREAAGLEFDAGAVVVAGHSAGGHLTAMAALTHWHRLDGAAPPDLVRWGVSISGLYDLRPIRHCYLNDRLGMDDAVAERNSPLLRLADRPAWLPPLTCLVGGAETPAFLEQQDAFAAAWSGIGGTVTAVTAPGRHHFDIVDEAIRPGGVLHDAVAALAAAGRKP